MRTFVTNLIHDLTCCYFVCFRPLPIFREEYSGIMVKSDWGLLTEKQFSLLIMLRLLQLHSCRTDKNMQYRIVLFIFFCDPMATVVVANKISNVQNVLDLVTFFNIPFKDD